MVAVNIDTRDLDKPKAWLQEVGIKRLGYYADPSAKVFQDLKAIGKAFGMPTTLLIDPNGCELGDARRPRRMGERGRHQADRGCEGALALLWQIVRWVGFPNQAFSDS